MFQGFKKPPHMYGGIRKLRLSLPPVRRVRFMYTQHAQKMNLNLVPDDVVNGILFLLSEKAAMINGIVMPIDGGYTSC